MMDRVKLLAPDLVFYHELEIQTVESLETMFERVFELSHGLDKWYLIVDIRGVNPPSLEIRKRLQEIYGRAKGLKHVVLITGMNRLLALIARFVAGNVIKIPYSNVKDFDAAMKRIEEVTR